MSEKDLSHHYKFLKQFLDISDDSNGKGKSTSVRAAKAREKLLKLSEAQFKELSTDVYDELRRRIDESRGEPDYLLPKSSFHPKRNQARQKLSSLPQSRFKDLVSDISFEIKRRNLHSSISEDNGDITRLTQESGVSQAESALSQRVSDQSEESAKDKTADISNKTIGVQSKTVIPTKTDLAWSSDEDEEEADEESKRNETQDYSMNGHSQVHRVNAVQREDSRDEELTRLAQECTDKDQEIGELKENLSTLRQKKSDVEDMYRTLQKDFEQSRTKVDDLNSEVISLKKDKENLTHQLSSKSSDEVVSKEFDNLKAANAALRLENQSLKNSASSKEPNHIKNSSIDSLSAESRSSSVTLKNDLKKNMELFFEKLTNLDASKTSTRGSTYAELRNDVTKWQNRYEELRSKQVTDDLKGSILTKDELNTFVSPTGLISVRLVADFHAMMESFFLYLNGSAFDSDILFERISRISVVANEIAAQGDNHSLNSNENSIYLREAISYALTATRYFAVYSKVFPKFVLERALGEVCFTVCDLITVSKLNGESMNERISQSNNESTPSKNITEPVSENFSARPLRIANKLKEIQKSNESLDNLNVVPDKKLKSPTISKISNSSTPLGKRNETKESNRDAKSPYSSKTPLSNGQAPEPVSPVKEPISKSSSTVSNSRNIGEQQSPTGLSSKAPKESKAAPIFNKHDPKAANSANDRAVKDSFRPGALKSKALKADASKAEITNADIFKADSPEDSASEKKNEINSNSLSEAPESESVRQKRPDHTSESIESSEKNEKSPKSKSISALASRFEQQSEPQITSTKSSPSTKGAGVAYLASRLSASSDNSSSKSNSPNTTPTKKNIFERVRQFENSAEESKRNSSERGSPSSTLSARRLSAGFESDDSITSQGSKKSSPEKVSERLSRPFKISETDKNDENASKDAEVKADIAEDSKGVTSSQAASSQVTPVNGGNKINNAKNGNRNSADLTTPETIASSVNSQSKNSPGNSESLTSEENSTGINDGAKSEQNNSTKNGSVPSTKKSVKYAEDVHNIENKNESDEEIEAKQRQEYRKSVAAANFNVDLFDIDDPDNTLTQVLLYLEHQTVEVISTIQSLLSAIKKPSATRGELREKSSAITLVISQMTEATNTSMNQTRNAQFKEHGNWVVKSLEDCHHRMNILCKPDPDRKDSDFADKNFKQRLAGISFDIAKCTKELVKTVEEASIKEEIAHLDARLSHADDLT